MPAHAHSCRSPVPRLWPRRSALAACALLVAGLAIPGSARPESAKVPCGALPAPEEVLQRLIETRARGAVCHAPGGAAIAAPLRWSANLAAVAAAQSSDMAELNHMSHRDSQNRTLTERLAAMGYRFSAAAENVAFGYSSLDAVVEAWLDSESHCDNLMNANVLELGMACSDSYAGRAPGEGRYWTLVLGAPPRSR